MNWFRKIAFPVVERGHNTGPTYLDIGHVDDMGQNNRIYVWHIDNEWRLNVDESKELLEKVKKENPDFEYDYAAHDDVMNLSDPQTWIAKGRTVERPEGNVASYTLSPMVWKQGLFVERKYKEKIEEILDKNFDNPKIYSS